MQHALTINITDDAAVALTDLTKGSKVTVNEQEIELLNNITAKHKFALKNFSPEDEVHMYGVVVGIAKEAIKPSRIAPIRTASIAGNHQMSLNGKT